DLAARARTRRRPGDRQDHVVGGRAGERTRGGCGRALDPRRRGGGEVVAHRRLRPDRARGRRHPADASGAAANPAPGHAAPRGRRPGRRTLATALLNALRTLSASAPLLVAVEDAQWVDESSQETLAFAIRRLTGADVRLLVTVRADAHSALAEVVDRESHLEL